MDTWSAIFTVAALAGVVVTFLGAWWMVRAFRARRPGGTTDRTRQPRPEDQRPPPP